MFKQTRNIRQRVIETNNKLEGANDKMRQWVEPIRFYYDKYFMWVALGLMGMIFGSVGLGILIPYFGTIMNTSLFVKGMGVVFATVMVYEVKYGLIDIPPLMNTQKMDH